MKVKVGNNDTPGKLSKSNRLPIKNMFGRKKNWNEVEDTSSKDLAIVTQMNQEFAKSLI